MKRTRSIGLRLTSWYFAVLAAALICFGTGMWFAMRQSLYGAVDDTLEDRIRGVQRFIQEQGASLSPIEMRDEFREHSVLGPGGDLFQVSDSKGVWIYRSAPLEEADVPVRSTQRLEAGEVRENLLVGGAPLRFLSRNVEVRGQLYAVQVAAPLHELNEGLERIFWILLGTIPFILGLASLGGYWMSRRALGPVDQITTAARSISAQTLGRRLAVPRTRDELERLSLTLNDMFERLDAAFGRITRFTADASHELRTPIAFMRTTAEVALRKQRSEDDYRAALARILRELERTSRLVEDLLMLARADSGSAEIQAQRVNLSQTVMDVCEQGKVLAESKDLRFEYQAPDSDVEVFGDPQALRRVFLILIDNAVKYTAAGGRVRVSLTRSNGWAGLRVADSGIGIAEQDLPHIFERFYRADKARSRETDGAGLGLAIARWIVEAHRGEIRVESVAGKGSEFSVALPVADAAEIVAK